EMRIARTRQTLRNQRTPERSPTASMLAPKSHPAIFPTSALTRRIPASLPHSTYVREATLWNIMTRMSNTVHAWGVKLRRPTSTARGTSARKLLEALALLRREVARQDDLNSREQ